MSADKYERQEMIGSGSFGRAWLVRRTTTGKPYVLKEIRVAGLSERDRCQVLTEVAALAKCRHVNVVRYRETFLSDTQTLNPVLCIVMEYAQAGDLRKKIDSQNGILFDGKLILDWFIQICFALKYIHGLRILHRDLKTSNIFLTDEGFIKVGDFGIARFLNGTSDQASTVIGTPYYLSPEICQHQPYGFKSDMWSAGCVFYEMCTHNRPFTGSTLSELIVNILHGKYAPIPSQYGPLVEDLVAVLLRSDPEQRPTASDVLSIPLVRPLADIYTHRINAAIDCRNGRPSFDARRASVSDLSADDSNSTPRSSHRNSDAVRKNGDSENHEMPIKGSNLNGLCRTPSGDEMTNMRGVATPTETVKDKESVNIDVRSKINNKCRDVRHKSCGTPVVFSRSTRNRESGVLSENVANKQRLGRESNPASPKMSVYREVLQRRIREPAEKALLAEKILGRIAQNKMPTANSKCNGEKVLAAANKGHNNSPSSAKHIADDNEVFWALANGYAPTISSIPTRLEFLRGFLRSKFSADRFCHYHHQIEIIITATSSSSNQRDLERVVSMLKNDDALKYFALFTELLQLETFAGLA